MPVDIGSRTQVLHSARSAAMKRVCRSLHKHFTSKTVSTQTAHALTTMVRRARLGTVVLLIVLVALLVGAAIFAYEGFVLESGPLPTQFYVAMVLGGVFTIAVGAGLMALVFYSSRHGYDKPPKIGK